MSLVVGFCKTKYPRLSTQEVRLKLMCFLFLDSWLDFSPGQDTVYGKRDGVLTGLAVTHKDSRNYFHSTRGWKTGTVHGIGMCPRAEMYKPETVTLA